MPGGLYHNAPFCESQKLRNSMSNWEFWSPYMKAWRRSWSGDMTSLRSRFYAHLDMLVFDHGWSRYFIPNLYRISDQVWRSNHPPPLWVAWAKRRGIKTIINLRGDNDLGSYILSSEACERYGIKQVILKTYSRRLPSKELIHQAKQLFEEVEYPILMHCKSGADRAGIMSALYLILHEGRSVSEAKRQLHWRYGHIRQTNTGILDRFFEAYEKANREKPIDFLTWVDTEYDPAAISNEYKNNRWGNFLDRLMRRE